MTGNHDPHQLTFEWSKVVHTDVTPPPENPCVAPDSGSVAPTGDEDQLVESPPLVQYLPWDFRTTFPDPLDDAIEVEMIDEEDVLPENLAALHEAQAQEMLGTLSRLDAIHDLRAAMESIRRQAEGRASSRKQPRFRLN